MNAKTRRRIGGYIWNEQMTRLHGALEGIRTTTEESIAALQNHPPSIRLLLTLLTQMALHLNAATAALRELETIARDFYEEN